MRHEITPFEHQENAVLDPIVLAIAVFSRRGLLIGTVDEILAKAAMRPDRRIVIGTPADVNKPVLLHFTKSASYNDELEAASSSNIRYAVNEVGSRGGMSMQLGGHAPRRGATQDANQLHLDDWQAGTDQFWLHLVTRERRRLTA